MNDKLEQEKNILKSLVKLPRGATVVRENMHMLIFTCNVSTWMGDHPVGCSSYRSIMYQPRA